MIPYRTIRLFLTLASLTVLTLLAIKLTARKDEIISFIVDPRTQDIRFYWRDGNGNLIGSFKNLRELAHNEGRELVFAMNGGIYMEDQTPLGLFIEDGISRRPLNRSKGYGNFYVEPNGIFYITSDGQAAVTPTVRYKDRVDVKYATQSGPMLVIDGRINEIFREESESVNIRNGVGILPDNKILFAISRQKINLYSFAQFFLNQGCENALYLDGFVSKMYLPEKKLRKTGGKFGVIIGVTGTQTTNGQ